VSQKLKHEEKLCDVIERKKLVEVEEQEVQRKERDLVAAVKLPAEAEAYRVQAYGKLSIHYHLKYVFKFYLCIF
jgi:flotillin